MCQNLVSSSICPSVDKSLSGRWLSCPHLTWASNLTGSGLRPVEATLADFEGVRCRPVTLFGQYEPLAENSSAGSTLAAEAR